MKRDRLMVLVLASLISLSVIALLGLNASSSGRAEEGAPILEYPEFPPTPTIGPQPAARPNPAGVLLASENFDSPDALARWEIVDPAGLLPEDRSLWSVEDGVLVQNRTAAAGDPSIQETMALTGDPAWTDYTLSANVYDQNNATFGLVARRQGNSFYRYRIIADQFEATPKQILEKVVDGVATPLATRDSPGYTRRQWHTIAMSVAGPNIRVTLDGTLVAEAGDTTLSSGQAGLYTRALGGIRFDDVTVTAP
ncbi:MAG TPA: family 16 glycoside hydrolase [Roseiflexaceae bacterium]|nr:family 16 glycoside hydrolase [Roseiflexaceae bacterium]